MDPYFDHSARRGDILTRDGKVLATSKPVYTISVSHLNNQELEKQVAQRLESLLPELDISSEAILEKLSQHSRRYEPMEILKLPWGENALEIISRIEERRGELPGVVIQSEPMLLSGRSFSGTPVRFCRPNQ